MARSFTLRNAISLLAVGFLANTPVTQASSIHHLHHRHLHHPHLQHHERSSQPEAVPSGFEAQASELETRDNVIRKRSIPTYATQGFSLTWADDFSSSSPLSNNWIFDIGHNYVGGPDNWGTGEIQSYTSSSSNAFVDSYGYLNIVPIKSGNSWTSSRIESKMTSGCQAGGRMIIEAKIKLPAASSSQAGIWPAFWAMGKAFRDNGNAGWPTTGELDIMENVNGQSKAFNVVHCGTNGGGPCDEYNGIGNGGNLPLTRNQFNVHRLIIDRTSSDWRAQTITWQLNAVTSFQITGSRVADQSAWTALTAQNVFLLLNVAVGGSLPNAFSGGVDTPTSTTTGGTNSAMQVDYVAIHNAAPAAPPPSNGTPSPIQPGQVTGCGGWRFVQPSDTCANLVSRYASINLSLAELVKWNPALGTTSRCSPTKGYYICVQLAVPSPVQSGQVKGCSGWRYTKSGNTCASIVNDFKSIGLTLNNLVKWNPALGTTSSCRITPGYYVCVVI
ncbi:Beta-glucanase [Orbilia brochopaga]|nr:Beta-glucanase [Drechslerella brochopaga]